MAQNKLFNRDELKLKPLSERVHDLNVSSLMPLTAQRVDEQWREVAQKLKQAKAAGAPIILMAGGHLFRSGIQNYLIDLMRSGYVSCLATNGAGMIHDFELALAGATTEQVARYINEGQFGLWQETGRLNDIINEAYKKDANAGMGEAVGQAIQSGAYPQKEISLFAAAYQLGIPVTVHVGIGYDIISQHPNCDGAATGATSYNDFLKFAEIVRKLEGGVVMDFGSAVMAPEVFLKALSMARNAAKQQGATVNKFTTLVCDLYDLPANFRQEPPKDERGYYFRPWKTLLVRTTAEGGESFYIKGRHAETIPALWSALNEQS
jgi:Deoxyhypusine synthase